MYGRIKFDLREMYRRLNSNIDVPNLPIPKVCVLTLANLMRVNVDCLGSIAIFVLKDTEFFFSIVWIMGPAINLSFGSLRYPFILDL